jgi:hypothetical protein
VSARVEAPESLEPERLKALGAGNEVGIYPAEVTPEEPSLEAVVVAREGIRWQ